MSEEARILNQRDIGKPKAHSPVPAGLGGPETAFVPVGRGCALDCSVQPG